MAYTFALHSRRFYEASQAGVEFVQWVQVKVSGVTACARLVDLWTTPDQVDLWRVDLQSPFRGLFYVAPGRTRQCSGLDGRCVCACEAAAEGQAKRASAAASQALGGRAC